MDRREISYVDAFNKRSQKLQMVAEEPAPYGTKKED
jgi:type I restriction enzyme R subunit